MKAHITFISLLLLSLNTSAQNTDIELKNTDNKWVNLENELGEKVTIIDFWATWCKPCVNAMPKINELHNRYKDKGVKVIGINVDGPRNQAKVKPLIHSLKIDYPILLDMDEELMNEFNTSVLPTLYILDKKGKLIFTHEGFSPGDENILIQEIEKLL